MGLAATRLVLSHLVWSGLFSSWKRKRNRNRINNANHLRPAPIWPKLMAAHVGVVRFMSRKVKCEICGATSCGARVHCAKGWARVGWGGETTTKQHMINETLLMS